MLAENKNLKDSERKPSASYGAGSQNMSFIEYSKTQKLITALYMVTDIIDKDEPLRNKLRTLGTGIISDIHTTPSNILNKISQIMSFLDIASALNIVSEMNINILKKEFLELNRSITESTDKVENLNKQINLSEFFTEPTRAGGELPVPKQSSIKGHFKSIRHRYSNSIGVQKGSTLMKALSDTQINSKSIDNFDTLKKQRRDDIEKIIKNFGGNATIKDIKDKVQTVAEQSGSLMSYSEKTLQRELISMVKEGVLNKTGEKRWSRYFLNLK